MAFIGTFIKDFIRAGIYLAVFAFLLGLCTGAYADEPDYKWEDFRVIVDGNSLTLDEANIGQLDLVKSIKAPLQKEIAELEAVIGNLETQLAQAIEDVEIAEAFKSKADKTKADDIINMERELLECKPSEEVTE